MFQIICYIYMSYSYSSGKGKAMLLEVKLLGSKDPYRAQLKPWILL